MARYVQYLLDNMEQFDFVSIDRRDLDLLNENELKTLYEVCKDRKTYNLVKSHLSFDPKLWDQASLKVWIDFVSEKYVDNNEVDMTIGETEALERELRNYWQSQQQMWADAANIYNLLKELSLYRDQYEKNLRIAVNINLSHAYPPFWTRDDQKKFFDWYKADIDRSCKTPEEFFADEMKSWQETFEIIHRYYGIDLKKPESMEEDEDEVVEIRSEEMSPSSIGIPDCTPSPSPQAYSTIQEDFSHFYPPIQTTRYTPDYGDPEDWDREILNGWLHQEFSRCGIDFNTHSLAERCRRLIMIYVRCAWPCDTEKNSLYGLCRIFSRDIGSIIYDDILKMRPTNRAPETIPKPDSQRHRNRRDLHLWEFLLILLANPESERESIHWKNESQGIFELANRHRVAKLWGLTKGNVKMTYDNMSRSVRQYYKDDKTGIMIRHQTGTQSLGKYSYQFSMSNSEVKKLWQSLMRS